MLQAVMFVLEILFPDSFLQSIMDGECELHFQCGILESQNQSSTKWLCSILVCHMQWYESTAYIHLISLYNLTAFNQVATAIHVHVRDLRDARS